MIQELPHSYENKVVWGSRYPHHEAHNQRLGCHTGADPGTSRTDRHSPYDGRERPGAIRPELSHRFCRRESSPRALPTIGGQRWSEVVQRLHVAGEPRELGLLLHGTRPVPSPVWVYRKDGSVGVEALVARVGGHPVVGGWDEPVCWVVVYRFLNGDAFGVRVPLGVFNYVCVL